MFSLICFKSAEFTLRKCQNLAFLPNFPPFLPPKVRRFAPVMSFFITMYLNDIVLMIGNVCNQTGHRKVHKQGTDNINQHFDPFFDLFLPQKRAQFPHLPQYLPNMSIVL